MNKNMQSEWKVTKNYIGDGYMYAVYRLKNTAETDHSGNREFSGGYIESREGAAAAAEKLNAEAQAAPSKKKVGFNNDKQSN